ncbi:hypothetical protein A2630_02365 [Candidatus Woesebacteria bacterium RIFCSPHIGHO2_01_FULL_44_10]|uniref:HD/PDEase domain-containing protein n=1 Tax=Candidatus Woesebacteria bacterium RIFCSPLOWO2_01_FULL_44_14 TaxID=1802525 RepID=A0A1F8C0R7_9BACT|nr:MAG: hypothetical protein A2630_02365 [Candidatus Woesebacteria bacterium RIFCSPHIGHO2_01_FULL_44_10]OGM69943.1 MAG: hypothetical protein A2975_05025 [Candidatus Woesebacteria bacterium RIFCSPLOWO2_01_FULL_44_14]
MKSMVFEDRIYGQIRIDDPMILELIRSRPFQRLKKINQYGGVNFIYLDKYQISRYEHSIGVWWVLKTLGVDLETQIAGLLHDVGHAALSHMVDMAMSDEYEDYHERNRHRIDDWEDINKILRRHKIRIGNPDDYPEIKKSLPDIGADRFDYAIRDYVGATNKKRSLGLKALKAIRLEGRDVVFTNTKVTKEFALTGLQAMWFVIYEPSVAVVYQAVIEMIRLGVKDGWITEDDLFENDSFLLTKFKRNRNRIPAQYVNIFLKPFIVKNGSQEDHDFHHVKLKARFFDPTVLTEGHKVRLSKVDRDFAQELKHWIDIFEKGKSGQYYKIAFL